MQPLQLPLIQLHHQLAFVKFSIEMSKLPNEGPLFHSVFRNVFKFQVKDDLNRSHINFFLL